MKDCRKLGGKLHNEAMDEEATKGTNWTIVFTVLGFALFWALLMLILL